MARQEVGRPAGHARHARPQSARLGPHARLLNPGLAPPDHGRELRIEDAALYPALHRMEARGLIEAEWGLSENNRKAKFYRLTAAGRRELRAESESWTRYVSVIGKVMSAAEQAGVRHAMSDKWSDERPAARPIWRRYLRFRGRDVRADVADELEFHIEMIAARG